MQYTSWELSIQCPPNYSCEVFGSMDDCLSRYKNNIYTTCLFNQTATFQQGHWRKGFGKLAQLFPANFYPIQGKTLVAPNCTIAQIRPYTYEEKQELAQQTAYVVGTIAIAGLVAYLVRKLLKRI